MTSGDPEVEVAEAAHESSVETVEAIEEAAQVNDDPVVADALDEASLHATVSEGRIDWIRRRLRRLFSH